MSARKPTFALSLFAASLAAVGALLNGGTAHADVIVADTFTLNDTDREAGDGLNGLTSEVGGAVWEAGGSMVFSTVGDITVNSSAGSVRIASVPLGGPSALDDIVSVTADVNPTGTGNAGVGFTADHGGFNGSSEVNLWVSLSNGGTLALRQNGNGAVSQVSIGSETYFNESALNTVSLIVDRVASLVDVVVNGTTVFNNVAVTLAADEAYLTRAGFQFTNPGTINGPRGDNFQVASVPEPASIALALPVALAMFKRGRRDQQMIRG